MDARMAVDAQYAALDGFGHADRAAQIVRPERTAQSVGGGVDVPDHPRFVLERGDAHNRAEDFLAPAAICLVHLQQDGRFQIVTLRARTAAATGERVAALPGLLEKFSDPGALPGGDQRPQLGVRLGRLADNEFLGSVDELLDKQLARAPLDRPPAARAPVLA